MNELGVILAIIKVEFNCEIPGLGAGITSVSW